MRTPTRIITRTVLLTLLTTSCAVTSVRWPARLPVGGAEDPESRVDAAEALQRLRRAPDDEEAIIWYGRRLGYLGLFEEAIAAYSQGLVLHPESLRLLRHRGHRYLSLRKLEEARRDLERARQGILGTEDRVEQDGKPNAQGIPTSTLHTNVYYHLGLAYYCLGRFSEAAMSFAECLAAAGNVDMEVAARYWCFLSAHRTGNQAGMDAASRDVDPAWEIVENHAYHQLLLLFAGKVSRSSFRVVQADGQDVQNKTLAYGLARHLFVIGEPEKGRDALRKMIVGGGAAFGVIAAESDLAPNPVR